ncbi:MAG: glycosyltransferase family 4 protein [Planctomycetota bacterium]
MSDAERAPRVLYLSYNFPPKVGGLELVVRRTWQAFSETGEVTALAQHAEGAAPDDEAGVRRAPRPGMLRYLWFALRRGRRLVSDRAVDVVVSGSGLTALPAVRLARRAGARSMLLVHGLDVVHPSFLYQRLLRYALPRASLVVANSEAVRREVLARGGRPDAVRVIHPGCDAERFAGDADVEGFRERWGIRPGPVILTAGRLVPRKGVDRFVGECLPRVLAHVPDATFVVAGGDPRGALVHGGHAEAVRRAADEAGLSDHVVITGRLPDGELAAAFRLASVFVLPAVPVRGDMEGFGIVLLEAAAAGVPAVAAAVGGITDAVEHGVSGILVPPGDDTGLAEAVRRFLEDEDARRQFGEAGRCRVLRDFTWDAAGRRYVDALLALCGRDRTEP